MSRRIDRELPGADRRVAPLDALEKGWEAIFEADLPPPLDLVVEVGFGRGEFLTGLSIASPKTAFVGIELSHKRSLKMARRMAAPEFGNVRLLEGRAERVVPELFPPASVSGFWVNFPDPWPKKRHHKNRLIQSGFVRDLASRLRPGGELQIATDDPSYAEWIDHVLAGEAGLENVYAPAPHVRDVPDRPRTAFEEEWRSKGRVPYFWTYRRPGAPTDPTR